MKVEWPLAGYFPCGESIKTLPHHQRLVLYVIASNGEKEMGTNEIYAQYKTMCDDSGATLLSKIRISSFISELDVLGLISAKKFYKGHYERIRLVASNVSKQRVERLLYES